MERLGVGADVIPPPPPGFTLDEIPPPPEGFTLDSASTVEARILEMGGVKQPDGTYVVPGEVPLRLDAQGNQLDAPAIGEESTTEAIGNRVLATAASGAQGFIPQIAGAAKVVATAPQNAGEVYRQTRDSTKATIEQAREKAGIGYDIAGAVLSSGLAAPETLAGRMALAGGTAAVNAAASSDVDLTKDGDLGEFAKDVATGAGIGLASAGVGEGAGAGIRKLGGLVTGNAAKIFEGQVKKEALAIEKNIASLSGKVGAETQKGSRLIENLQRGTEGLPAIEGARELAEGVLANNRATLPGQLATIDAAKVALREAIEEAPGLAEKRAREYFAQPLFRNEILPRIKQTLAPRFGMAALGLATGAGADLLTGGDGSAGGGFAGAVLGAPGMYMMLRNVAKSARVQYAVATKLAPLLQSAANTVAKGVAPSAAMLTQYVLTEEMLGNPELAAQQLVARGGINSLLGDNGTDKAAALNAPKTELDAAIAKTTGVLLLGGALEEQNKALSDGLDRVFKGKPEAAKKAELPDFAALKANPNALLERLSTNTGNLSSVAPMVAAEMAATAQRAADFMLQVSQTPPRKGPLQPEWVRSDGEKRSIRLAAGVIAQPMSILESAAAGMLVPEQVTALNAVYPMLGRQMADMALDKLTSGGKVPYRARLMVGFLAGVDPDGTFASIGPNQLAIRAQSQKPSNMAPPPGGADKLTLAQRTSGEVES